MLFEVYRRTARQIQRLEAVTRSPYLNVLTESVNNLVALRAYRFEPTMQAGTP